MRPATAAVYRDGATTDGSAARGSLSVDLPDFDPEMLAPLVEKLDGEVPERVVGLR